MKTVRRNSHQRHSALFAVLLIVVGLVLLGLNLGFVSQEYKDIFFTWPMLMVVIGIISFSKQHFWSGAIWFMLGSFFLVPHILSIYPDLLSISADHFVNTYWPALLVAGGIISLVYLMLPYNIRHRKSNRFCRTHFCDDKKDFFSEEAKEYVGGYFKRHSVFSSGKYIVLDPIFKGGEINTVFGDTLLDLRKTDLADGETVINVNTVFGSIKIYVPEHWKVDIKLESIMYTFKDERLSRGQADETKRLIIRASGVLGSGELRN
ncbi:LiaF domain-containing protein [uncultured Bacteroides sp.]|uniref:LiaF domain-containing protein n=1 Tax=uncultured Bacteroides sp. TaxID=162156 RepID=UPI002AAA644C|nr:LiaF domain-containing protein [uncultured Bacteroides sp.]